MDELKHCPFCGGKAQIRYTGNGSGPMGYTSNMLMRSKPGFVMCLKCEIMTPRNSRVCRAIEKWNRRAGEEDKHETDLDKFPTIDAVPAIRCRECKHCDPENYHCDHPMGTAAPLRRKPDDFCSYGERKDGDNAT